MMHSALQDMLKEYDCRTADDYRHALNEIVQEIALLGLYRGGFFTKAAFYGGTALRIFYGLDRFSEDLDFLYVQIKMNYIYCLIHFFIMEILLKKAIIFCNSGSELSGPHTPPLRLLLDTALRATRSAAKGRHSPQQKSPEPTVQGFWVRTINVFMLIECLL